MNINLLDNKGDIKCDYQGFSCLVEFYDRCNNCMFEEIEVDMGNVQWLDAHMCSPFGAILYQTSVANFIKITNINKKVGDILSKNGFLSSYGWMKNPDTFQTTVEYKRFDTKDIRYFNDYVISDLVTKKGLPRMLPKLRKKFVESICEIFDNAIIHSQTRLGIFSCGQFFPFRKRLDFSISDLGIGICQNIKQKLDLDLSPEKAIQWAVEGNNTTKAGYIPGGSGLKILREFITMNKGKIQIVSDRGFWELSDREETSILKNPFPGTVVTIEINTADKSKYGLTSEINPENVFN
ncbi:HAMP domain-containing histidine kinase [candidate division FCPU426 bacterium]|nr:HAMP domain-containing histidine kinase [candidate division FCPU426 bacterium]